MNTYKITNITNLLAKRNRKFNTTIAIEYIDKMTKKIINIIPNNSVYLTVSTLPLSIHRLRIKNLIIVNEVAPAELAKTIKTNKVKTPKIAKPKAVKKPIVAVEKNKPVKKKKLLKNIDEK